jgi:type I restriction-modification system DNA methylase subunit
MALKRNLDIQGEQLVPGHKMNKILATELKMLESGLRDPKDVTRALNGVNGFWDPSMLKGNRFGLPLLTWPDLVNFKDSATSGPRPAPYVMILRANPPDHQTEDTALFTYATTAPDLKALILEIITSMVPDLREAFGAIGIHGVMGAQSEFTATISNTVLREICTQTGAGGTARLVDFDLGLENVSVDVFSDTYMDLLGRFAEDSGKRGGEYFTPTPLAEKSILFLPIKGFAQKLSDDPSFVMRIADPTAGSNTFLVKTHERLMSIVRAAGLREPEPRQLAFYAQELKNTQVGLGVFNMFYHGLAQRLNPTEEEVSLHRPLDQGGIIARINGNSISNYVTKIGQQAGKIHAVVANPPYGSDDYGIAYALGARSHAEDARWSAGVPTRSEGEWPFVQTIVDLLSPIGCAVVVLPLGVLFRDGGADYRQWLIEKDWVEGIIATPSNQFLTTPIPVFLLVINKNKPSRARNGVFFINASEDFTKVGKFNHWNVQSAVDAWENRSEIPGYSGFVSIERLRKAPKYSLAVNRWFSPIREKVELDPVSLTEQVTATRVAITTRGAWLDGVFAQAAALSADGCAS